jgi:hypothetical protein
MTLVNSNEKWDLENIFGICLLMILIDIIIILD